MTRLMFPLIAALLLSSCAAVTPLPPNEGDPGPDACGAAARQGLVGQPLAALDRAAVTGPLRIIPPGTSVTMDYSPARLNVETDTRGRMVRITCG